MKSLILKGSLLLLLLTTCLSCQKSWILEGTWARTLPEYMSPAVYQFAVFDKGSSAVTYWYETADRVKLEQITTKYSMPSTTEITFHGYTLTLQNENTLKGIYGGENVAFFRQ